MLMKDNERVVFSRGLVVWKKVKDMISFNIKILIEY